MKNDVGGVTEYDRDYFNEKTTRGVVLIDAPSLQGKLHFDTLRLTTEAPHPIAIMTRSDFEAIWSEVDTASDLGLYLGDRHVFLKEVFHDDPSPFLQLGNRLEQELISLYKLGENTFDLDRWKTSVDKRFWYRYQIERGEDIARRNQENAQTAPIDDLMSEIRKLHGTRAGAFTIQHAWELALRTRRERAVLVTKIEKKISSLFDTGREQKFAAKNGTGCWDVFYFYRGIDSDYFRAEAQRMADRKLWIECSLNDFKYSVFCFAMRYSPISLGGIVEVVLTVSDASGCPNVTPDMLSEARVYFAGQTATWPVTEFPQF